MILEPYVPKKFGKDIHRITPAQYPMLLSTIFGLKPSYDDWIMIDLLDEYVDICKSYNLVVETDIIFKPSKQSKESIIGGKNITTTFSEGAKFDKTENDGCVHVFVSKSRDIAIQAKKAGWYSVVINGRTTNKPFIDHLKFGKLLGFPDCCIDFFRKYNNWTVYNHPFESFKNTPKTDGEITGSYYCNNFLMDNTYFYIHHIPCSYKCEKTIELARKVEESILEAEPLFVEKTTRLLRKPLLVLGERNFVIFDGILSQSTIKYKDSQYFMNPARPEEKIEFFDSIRSGNEIMVENEKIKILRNETEIKTIAKMPEWFLIGFE